MHNTNTTTTMHTISTNTLNVAPPPNVITSVAPRSGKHNHRERGAQEVKAQQEYERQLIKANAALPSHLRAKGHTVIIYSQNDPLRKVGGVEVLPTFKYRFDPTTKKSYVALEVR